MKVSCRINIDFDSKEKTENVFKSIKVDDFSFVSSKVNNKTLEAEIKANSISSILHTIDDYLACVSVAEKIVDKDK
jgi:tRNA threonylcarbamoyladenosine modification (KEOPS) complex  Pcc1 subunit